MILQWFILGGCVLTAADDHYKHERANEYTIDIFKKFNIDASNWNNTFLESISYLAMLPGVTYAIYKLNT